MKTTLYYFSATGNSLSFARSLAAELDDAACMAIPKAMEEGHSDPRTPGIGLIFPVYSWGPPRIVTDFARKLTPGNGQYVFAVATCGGTPGGAMLLLEDTLTHNGVTLDAGFVVSEGSYEVIPEIFLMRVMKTLGKQKPSFQPGQSGKERLSDIAAVVKNRQHHGVEANAWAANFLAAYSTIRLLTALKPLTKIFGLKTHAIFVEHASACVRRKYHHRT